MCVVSLQVSDRASHWPGAAAQPQRTNRLSTLPRAGEGREGPLPPPKQPRAVGLRSPSCREGKCVCVCVCVCDKRAFRSDQTRRVVVGMSYALAGGPSLGAPRALGPDFRPPRDTGAAAAVPDGHGGDCEGMRQAAAAELRVAWRGVSGRGRGLHEQVRCGRHLWRGRRGRHLLALCDVEPPRCLLYP
jgi:hypothetical protein